MTNTEIKKSFFGVLTPHFKVKGFKPYLKGGDPSYVYYDGNIAIHFFFNFLTRFAGLNIRGGEIGISLYEVEDYLLNIGLPSIILDSYKKKEKYHLTTVSLFEDLFPSDAPELENKEEVEEYAYNFIEFYESKGVDFIKKYTYLPNILEEMDRLRQEGLYWHELLSGNTSHLIRALIISKLCNDKNYENKFDWVNKLFKDIKDKKELLYWEKYKKVLETIEPKYNLDIS